MWRILALLPVLLALAMGGEKKPGAFSLEWVGALSPWGSFITVPTDLSRYLRLTRSADVRTLSYGTLVPYPAANYDTNETRVVTLGAPDFELKPLWVDLGARAHFRLSPVVGLLAGATLSLGSHRQDRFQRYLLTDPGNSNQYLATLRVEGREEGSGSALVFSTGVRLTAPVMFLSVKPYLQLTGGAGPLLAYQTQTRLLAQLEENWVGASPLAFSNLNQNNLSLANSVTEDLTLTRTLTGTLFTGKIDLGLAFALGPALTSRLELGASLVGFALNGVTRKIAGSRAEYSLSGIPLFDPTTGEPTDFLSAPLSIGNGNETYAPPATWAFSVAWVLEQRF